MENCQEVVFLFLNHLGFWEKCFAYIWLVITICKPYFHSNKIIYFIYTYSNTTGIDCRIFRNLHLLFPHSSLNKRSHFYKIPGHGSPKARSWEFLTCNQKKKPRRVGNVSSTLQFKCIHWFHVMELSRINKICFCLSNIIWSYNFKDLNKTKPCILTELRAESRLLAYSCTILPHML